MAIISQNLDTPNTWNTSAKQEHSQTAQKTLPPGPPAKRPSKYSSYPFLRTQKHSMWPQVVSFLKQNALACDLPEIKQHIFLVWQKLDATLTSVTCQQISLASLSTLCTFSAFGTFGTFGTLRRHLARVRRDQRKMVKASWITSLNLALAWEHWKKHEKP